jgi:hypothetical protein
MHLAPLSYLMSLCTTFSFLFLFITTLYYFFVVVAWITYLTCWISFWAGLLSCQHIFIILCILFAHFWYNKMFQVYLLFPATNCNQMYLNRAQIPLRRQRNLETKICWCVYDYNLNFFLFYFIFLLCWVWVHCSIYKGSYNVSNTSYLNFTSISLPHPL